MRNVLLAVESSGRDGGGAALVTATGEALHVERLGPDIRGGAGLAPAAAACLEHAAAEDSLAGVAVDCGPGSYTGLRVGVIFAKAFAFARDLPVVGVGSLHAMARETEGTTVAVVRNARRGELYTAVYAREADGGALRVRRAPRAEAPAAFLAALAALAGPVVCTGEADPQLGEEKLREACAGALRLVPRAAPSPAAIGALGATRLRAAPGGDALHALQPAYPRREGVTMPVLGEPVERDDAAGGSA
jgi:tRNA threonylcarbamoyladenosine biosynthesis protein TsaB